MDICLHTSAVSILFFDGDKKLVQFEYELSDEKKDTFSFYDGERWVINCGKINFWSPLIKWR